jgi:small subunit ribosomal protein S17
MSYVQMRKVKEGLVVGDKMDKTVVVAVETWKVHRLYKKGMRVIKRYKAHDKDNACKPGDRVRIMETRPLSKDKRWRVTGIISKREAAATKPQANDSDLHQTEDSR